MNGLLDIARARTQLISPRGVLLQFFENAVADRHGSRAVNERIFRDFVVPQGTGYRQDFKCGSGGITALESTGAQRTGRIIAQSVVILLGYVWNEHVRVIGRRGRHHQNFTRHAIQHHHGAAPLAAGKDAFRILLPFQVEGGDDSSAGLGAYLQFIQNFIAVFIKHQTPYAGRSGQIFIEFLFQPRTAFHLLPQRVHVVDGAGWQFSLGSHIADDMAGDFLLRIGTDVNGQQLKAAHAFHFILQLFRFLRTNDVRERKRQPAAVLIMFPELFVGKRPRLSGNFLACSSSCARIPLRGNGRGFQKFQTAKPADRLRTSRPAVPRCGPGWGRAARESAKPWSWRKGACWCALPARRPAVPRRGRNQGQGIQAILFLFRFPGISGAAATPSRSPEAVSESLFPVSQVNRFHSVILSALLHRSPASSRSPEKTNGAWKPGPRPYPPSTRPTRPTIPGNVSEPLFSSVCRSVANIPQGINDYSRSRLFLNDDGCSQAAFVKQDAACLYRNPDAPMGVGIPVHGAHMQPYPAMNAHPQRHFGADEFTAGRHAGRRGSVRNSRTGRLRQTRCRKTGNGNPHLLDDGKLAARRFMGGFARANGKVHGRLAVNPQHAPADHSDE